MAGRRPKLILPRAVLLDMDGTLTEPMLDFPRIRAEMGIGDEPILEAMTRLDEAHLARARHVLHRHENYAASRSTLSRGCRPLLAWLRRRKIRMALITRNSRRSARIVMRLHRLELDAVLSRDDGPFKPNPESVFLACKKLCVEPNEVWLIGDGSHDVEAGNAAGAKTVWLSLGRRKYFAAEPWKRVRDLAGVLKVLKRIAKR
jgi:HAD superfamily hydrolase (TIGR01549 family)